MNEFIIPVPYSGDSAGISVAISGLEDTEYEKMELSINNSSFFEVTRNALDLSCSEPHMFQQLVTGKIYKVVGRLTVDGCTRTIECLMPATCQPVQNVRARSALNYHGGGMSKPMNRPQVEYKDGNN